VPEGGVEPARGPRVGRRYEEDEAQCRRRSHGSPPRSV
jgi:hypothetical protein